MNKYRRFAALSSLMLSPALILLAGGAVAQTQTSKDPERAKAESQADKRQQDEAINTEPARKDQASKPKQDKAKTGQSSDQKGQRELEEEEDI
jgi:hypothetical protein